MKKKSINLVSAVAVLAVLSGGYAALKNHTESLEEAKKEADEEEKTEIFSASSDEISSIKFLIHKNEVTFEKNGERWNKSDDKEFPVNQDALAETVEELSLIEADQVLEDVEDVSEYGLDQPQNTITITTTDETETVLRIGMENQGTNQYYIEKDGDASTVYVVDHSVIEPFTKKLYDYAQQETFPSIEASMIKRIQVESSENSYGLLKDENSLWKIEDKEGTEKADSAKAGNLTTTLSSLAYSSFVNYNCEDLSEYGLENPYAKIIVDYQEEVVVAPEEENEENSLEDTDMEDSGETEDQEEEEQTEIVDCQLEILVGNEAENDTRYVKVGDSNEIYTMANESLWAIIGKQKSDFWDLTVHYLTVNNLEKLKVIYQNENYTINVSRETSEEAEESQDGEDSTAVPSLSYFLDGEELENTVFTTFYNKVINMAGQRRLTEKYETTSSPEMIIHFTDTDGNESEVSYYSYDTNFCAAVCGEKVYLVNKMTVKEMIEAFENIIANPDGNEETNISGEEIEDSQS